MIINILKGIWVFKLWGRPINMALHDTHIQDSVEVNSITIWCHCIK